jgi:predicted dehydrogenase
MKRIKLGIVGCGYVAQTDYFPVLEQDNSREQIEVTAVCDVSPGRAEEVCRRFNFGRAYTNYEEMLKKEDLDLVAILTPIPLHYDQTYKAIQAGVHVYVQKTLTTNWKQSVELTKLAEEKGLILGASPGQMLNPYHQQTKKIIESGEIGKVCYIRGHGPHPGHETQDLFGIDPSWYYKVGGGPMMDVAVYPITSITGLVGAAKRITAFSGIAVPDRYWEGKKLGIEVDDNTVILLDFGEGVLASVHGNFVGRACNSPQVELFGSHGVINLGGWTKMDTPVEVFTPEKGWYATDPELKLQPKLIHTVVDLLHMTDCVREQKKPLITGEHAAHVIEIIEKGYESARLGKAVELETAF